jgi:hypothetical protein
MQETTGNLWNFHKLRHWIVIPINGALNARNENVMGAGIAWQAKKKYPDLPFIVGDVLKKDGLCIQMLTPHNLVMFPTKHHWRDVKSDLSLIEEMARELVDMCQKESGPIYLPQLGCGCGGLDWPDVKKVLDPILDDRFVSVVMAD